MLGVIVSTVPSSRAPSAAGSASCRLTGAFFTELAASLRTERPGGLSHPGVFRGAARAHRWQPADRGGLRRIFRSHRASAGTPRVRPHRLRHTYGTELAAAGIDLLVLRELMGHASPETTAGYVRLSAATLAAEYSSTRSMTGCASVGGNARCLTPATAGPLTSCSPSADSESAPPGSVAASTGRRRDRADRPCRSAAAPHPAPAAPHLRHQPDQRRDEPARSDGVARPLCR